MLEKALKIFHQNATKGWTFEECMHGQRIDKRLMKIWKRNQPAEWSFEEFCAWYKEGRIVRKDKHKGFSVENCEIYEAKSDRFWREHNPRDWTLKEYLSFRRPGKITRIDESKPWSVANCLNEGDSHELRLLERRLDGNFVNFIKWAKENGWVKGCQVVKKNKKLLHSERNSEVIAGTTHK
jgi:hypothetical protein